MEKTEFPRCKIKFSKGACLSLLLFVFFLQCSSNILIPPSTLIESLGAEPDTLNPILATDAYASSINSLVFDSLLERDRDTLELKPKLAEKFVISPDHLQYTFYLRRDVTWHDGQPFTADDVVYSFQKILDPKIKAAHIRGYFLDAGISKIEKVDDFTVRFVSTKPYFKALSVCGDIPLIPKHVYDGRVDFEQNPANRHPIGIGPYRFAGWRTGKKMSLERYENYWGTKPPIKRIEYPIIADITVALQVLKKGELDTASLRPIQWMKETNSEKFEKQFYKLKYVSPGFSYIGWNTKAVYFDDKRVRQAMTNLVDRQKLLEKLNFGLGRVVVGPFFIESPAYNRDLVPHAYNPEQAKKLLDEAGWVDSNDDGVRDKNGKNFEFTFLYPSASKSAERVATILKEDLQKVGLVMHIEKMEWAAFLDRIDKKNFDATMMGWSTGFEDDPYQIWHSSQASVPGGSNFISYSNAEADHLIEKARQEFNEKERNKLYWRFQEILYDEQPYTFLFSSDALVVVSKRFSNVIVHKAGLDIREWVPN
ncbi:MAG TPA: peptide-binding protein [Deltaproteobacteria bacterium]|nr:MAG: hypothetical protein A2048_05280 [Deltaproteobacteria bacterium GWA2_45_12]HBF14033.1 peptide-binding protein [Deltaproteobacteria bacterium]